MCLLNSGLKITQGDELFLQTDYDSEENEEESETKFWRKFNMQRA
jgi:hypothetical protein